MGLIARKHGFVVLNIKRHRPACASTQSYKCLYNSLIGKYKILTRFMLNFKILASTVAEQVSFCLINPKTGFAAMQPIFYVTKTYHSSFVVKAIYSAVTTSTFP